MNRRSFVGAVLGTCAGGPFLGVTATIKETPSPILTYRDLLTAPDERVRFFSTALRLTNGEVIRGSGLRYVSSLAITTIRRTFVFEDIFTTTDFEIEKTLLLDWNRRLVRECSPTGGRPRKVPAGSRLQLGQAFSMMHLRSCEYFKGLKGNPCKCLDLPLLKRTDW